jgi:hypothetical protein
VSSHFLVLHYCSRSKDFLPQSWRNWH